LKDNHFLSDSKNLRRGKVLSVNKAKMIDSFCNAAPKHMYVSAAERLNSTNVRGYYSEIKKKFASFNQK